MLRATELAEHFMTLADSKEGAAGLSAVLNEADKAAATEDPELVRYALMLFMTHHPKGNQLKLKSIERRAPQLVLPSRPTEAAILARETAAGAPSEASLNWFREDPKANEHHEHWHIVYPWGGIQGRTKDREGELFLYMHEQMIARYDAERLAGGLEPVKPFPLTDYSEQIPEGYDPDPHLREGDTPFSSRPPREQLGDLPDESVATLKRYGDNLLQAVQGGTFQNANQLGATVEASIDSIDRTKYGSYHNNGHVFLAFINDPQQTNPSDLPGVMIDPVTAIRDPIFFRWHKHIDDISFQWQERQAPNDFSDAPQVLMRKGLNGATPDHQSPDIILCFKDKVLSPGSDDSDAFWQKYGEENFGGANWDKDFSASDTTTSELQTTMRKRQIIIRSPEGDDQPETISYLSPREFFYFLRVENLANQSKDVTVRIFLAPTGSYAGIPEVSEDRRKWIEMDRFTCTLKPQPSQRAVIFRRADASSVIRKPAFFSFLLMLWPWGLVIVAWGILLLASLSSHLSALDHDYLLRESHLPWALALAILLGSWQLMTAAMMLPSALLTLPALIPFDQQSKRVWGKQAGFIVAYAVAWTVFALLAFLGDSLIHLLVSRWFWLYTHSWLIGTITFGVAGIFQMSPFKRRCLKMCSGFSSTYLSNLQEGSGTAWRLGARYGQFCIGSCWALMLVIFGTGGRSMTWMFALTVIVISEKSMPRYQHIRYVTGLALLLLAIGMILYYRSV